ncbi:MAG: NADP-dependent isocitrate dehydrogenase [Rikenellaceae bacterium]
MAKIKNIDGVLEVPDDVTIPYIEGDGVGREIFYAVQRIVDAAIKKSYGRGRKIDWMEVFAGEKSFNMSGEWLPEQTLNAFKEYMIGIKGPLTTPVGSGIRSLNVALRRDLDLYVCLRPVRYYNGVSSPLKEPEKVNMTIFRENTEDIYSGIEWEAGSANAIKLYNFLHDEMNVTSVRFPDSSAFGVKPVSIEGTERLVRSAINYAIENKCKVVTLVHKGNIMKFTEGGFKKWGYDLAEREFANYVFTQNEFNKIAKQSGNDCANEALQMAKNSGKIVVNDCIADAFLQNTLLTPEKFSVIATLNLNGDYISDQLAAMVGGIGIAPGANINKTTGHAIFEATHGTAPDIAGENCANPCSMLLSAVMMLRYIGWKEPAQKIETAIEALFAKGRATKDLARFMNNGVELSTSGFADEVIFNILN